MKLKITNKLIAILMSVIMLFGMPIVLGSNSAWAKTAEDKQITESEMQITESEKQETEPQKEITEPEKEITESEKQKTESETQKTESETPEANAKSKPRPAPTGISGGIEKIIGTTTAMEYASSSNAKNWTGCDDGTTSVMAGTWYVRFKITKMEKASRAAKVTVSEATYEISASPTELKFNNKNEGYIQPDAQNITVTNTGNSIVNLSQPSSDSFKVGELSKTKLEKGESVTFSVQPKAKLPANNYNESIMVKTDTRANAEVKVLFTVNEAFTVTIEDENQTLKAIPKGGSGSYTYQWYEGSSTSAFSEEQEVKVSPAETTTYKVVVNDTIEEKAATVEVTATPATHTITASPAEIEFAARNAGYTRPDAQTVKITNTGDGTVTLKQLSVTNFEIGEFSKTTLEVGETATFTVQPKTNMAVGSYNETIKVSTDKGTSAEVKVNFTVNDKFTVTISPNNATINKGQNQMLKANPEGGSGNYTYQWYEGNSATAFSTAQEVKVSPTKTTTYKVVVNDTIEDKVVTAKVTVTSSETQQAPKIIQGANKTWTKGSKNGMSFTSDADFSEFLSVSVDGKKIAEENYTVKSGSIIVTLKPEYLKTLAAGKHTLGIVSERGTAETTFTILNSKSDTAAKKTISKAAQTGDSSSLVLWSVIILITGSGIIGSIIINKRNKNARK
ncbi:MAG: hypothetical protein ACRC3H_11565 [Lachnospiraceae bacterium]